MFSSFSSLFSSSSSISSIASAIASAQKASTLANLSNINAFTQQQQSKSTQTTSPNQSSFSSADYQANYVLTNRFYVEMGGVIRAAFSECGGFGVDVKKEAYLEGGVNDQQRAFLGHAEFQDMTLKRGMTNDSTFWEWMLETLQGNAQGTRTRRNVNVLMMNQAGETMQLCTLIGAIPISWKAPAFQADSPAVAIEEMTLTYEGINLQHRLNQTLGASDASTGLARDDLGFFPSN